MAIKSSSRRAARVVTPPIYIKCLFKLLWSLSYYELGGGDGRWRMDDVRWRWVEWKKEKAHKNQSPARWASTLSPICAVCLCRPHALYSGGGGGHGWWPICLNAPAIKVPKQKPSSLATTSRGRSCCWGCGWGWSCGLWQALRMPFKINLNDELAFSAASLARCTYHSHITDLPLPLSLSFCISLSFRVHTQQRAVHWNVEHASAERGRRDVPGAAPEDAQANRQWAAGHIGAQFQVSAGQGETGNGNRA